jgi:hypothetical protein
MHHTRSLQMKVFELLLERGLFFANGLTLFTQVLLVFDVFRFPPARHGS